MENCINCLLAAYPSNRGVCEEHAKQLLAEGMEQIKHYLTSP
jgi:hypothetical protein